MVAKLAIKSVDHAPEHNTLTLLLGALKNLPVVGFPVSLPTTEKDGKSSLIFFKIIYSSKVLFFKFSFVNFVLQ